MVKKLPVVINIRDKVEKTMKIEGNFVIMKDGRMYIGKRKLKDNDIVYLPVKKIRRIILDAKEEII